jgi:hypothetical protein
MTAWNATNHSLSGTVTQPRRLESLIYVGGHPKIPRIFKNKLLKYFYKFETSVPIEELPLRLAAAIPAPLAVLETLSKIFYGNAVKGHQRFSLNLCNVSKLIALQILLHPREQKKLQGAWSGEWGGTPILFLAKREAFCGHCRGSTRNAGSPRQHFHWRR